MKEEDTGVAAFTVMIVIIAFLLVVCVICPLAIQNFSQQPYAIPLMSTGLALPFVYFFVFGGIALAKTKKAD